MPSYRVRPPAYRVRLDSTRVRLNDNPRGVRVLLKDKPTKPVHKPAPKRKTVLQLDLGDCRYPVGTVSTPTGDLHTFCCDKAVIGKPYCAVHYAIAYDPRRFVRIRTPRS